MRIPITKAVFDEAEKEAIIQPLETGWVVQGPQVAAFEKMFATYTGAHYAQACSNCTTALHLGLLGLGIGAGDKVVVPSFSYVASANAVEYTGAEVVFCDIELETFNIDVSHLAQLLKKDPTIKAVMPVHLFGLCADMQGVMSLANAYSLKVIEDAACAFDARLNGQHAGTFGDCSAFSFHPRKAITTGEGGMLITNDETLAKLVAQLKDHGASKSDLQRHHTGGSLLPDFNVRGFNYRMTDLQGALGVAQMQKATRIMQGRRRIAARYDEALQQFKALKLPTAPANSIHAYQSYVCLYQGNEGLLHLDVNKIKRLNRERNVLMQKLEARGIATRQGTHAIHTLNYYKNRYQLAQEAYLQAFAADHLSITLPLYAQMSNEEFDYVIANIQEVLKECAVSVA